MARQSVLLPAYNPGFSMIIRKSQIAAFSSHMRNKYEEQEKIRLRLQFKDETASIDEPELRLLIHNGVSRSLLYGIFLELDVSRFIEYCLLFGSAFWDDPKYTWIDEILRRPDLSGSRKIDNIDRRIQSDAFASGQLAPGGL